MSPSVGIVLLVFERIKAVGYGSLSIDEGIAIEKHLWKYST